MKHLIIYAHPNPTSYNHALLEILTGLLAKEKHEVRVRDLYTIGFDPVLKAQDFISFQKGTVPEDIKTEQEHIQWADAITFVYPVWWFQMPAILKGYIDRVFARGFAYTITEKGLEGLLQGRKVNVINTTGGLEAHYIQAGYNDALKKTIDMGTFEVCGMEVVLHKFFYAVPFVTDKDRKEMLEEFEKSRIPLCSTRLQV